MTYPEVWIEWDVRKECQNPPAGDESKQSRIYIPFAPEIIARDRELNRML